MQEFKKFPKGEIKKSFHFYVWALVGVMFLLMGVSVLVTGEYNHRSLNLKGNDAYLFGCMLICFGVYILYYLIFKAEKIERDREGFHQLENFSELIENHQTTFKVEPAALPSNKGGAISVFFYKLEIFFVNELDIKLDIRRRDKIEYVLWKIGLTRYFDVLTGNYYFDSKYRVKTENKILLKSVLTPEAIKLFEKFDRDYPPIRNKNGTLILTEKSLRYSEGPYGEDYRLFDPHRGVIENLFNVLLKIVNEVER